ncbi:MAG: protein translocase subunit SecF [Clostridia bacterium]
MRRITRVVRGFSLMDSRRYWFGFSAILIVIGMISLAFQGLNLGVDFTGGSVLELDYSSPVTSGEVEGVLAEFEEMSGHQVIRIGEAEAPIMRIKSPAIPDGEDREELYAALGRLGDYEISSMDMVSPVIGRELTRNGLAALAVALVGMVMYITVRFQFRFAATAVITLLHDSLITLGMFSLLRVEVDQAFIAAILTIVGYSVNDTIVIFDRIRENLKYRTRGEMLSTLVDKSIHQSLSRSLITSITTFAAIAGIYLFGGASIKNFTFALMLGIVVGTYSSIFVASPIWLTWSEKRPSRSTSRT